jgi:predicted transcriptional regulator of viral defense system
MEKNKLKPYKLVVEKLARENKKFITTKELESYSKRLSANPSYLIKYLLRNKYISRIFKGIFYISSMEERKLGKSEMAFYELLKNALEIKGIKNWYFGLETALKMNNMTHEYFFVDYIITDTLYRAKPITIMDRKVKFYKISPKLMNFGIIREDIYYSDPEKTALDLLYLNHYDKKNFEEIAEKLSKNKLIKYSKKYDGKVMRIVEELGGN